MAVSEREVRIMTRTEEILAHPPAMAEMTGGLLESETDAVHAMTAAGHDPSMAVAAELAAEGQSVPADRPVRVDAVPAGLAALEAETEE
jgi:hypothetical protein